MYATDACLRSVTKGMRALKIATESTEEINYLEPHCIFNIYSRIIFLGRRGQLKCDGTRAETRFRLSVKWTSPFKSAGASVQSTAGSRDVCISSNNAGYTMFRGSVKGTGYPLHSPVSLSLPVPCVNTCHHISTGVNSTWPCGHFPFSNFCVARIPTMRWAYVVCVSVTDTWNSLWHAIYTFICPVVNFVNDSPIYMQFNCQAFELKIFSRWCGKCQNFLKTLRTSANDVRMIWVFCTLCWPSVNLADYSDKYRLRMTKWAAVVLITCLLHPTYRMIIAAVYKNVATWDNPVLSL